MKRAVAAVFAVAVLNGCWWMGQQASYDLEEPVCAKWSTTWWEAKVIGRDGDRYVVKYGDGTTGTVAAADMRRVLRRGEVRVGQAVYARWMGPHWYAGVVTALDDKGAIVKWDDGSTPSHADFGQIAPQ